MDDTLQTHATTVIECAQALLGERDGDLSDKQREVVKTIIANAERFIHVYAECQVMPTDEFVMKMRHEVGTPLTPIRGYSELLMMGMIGTLNEKQQEYVQLICDCTNELRDGVETMVYEARRRVLSRNGKTA